MDQTFLDNDSQLPKRTQEIIDRLEKEEKLFVVASGRTLTNLEHKFKDIKHNLSFISDNGGILKHKGEILHIETINPPLVKEVLDVFSGLEDSCTVLIQAEHAYVANPLKGHMEKLQEYYTNLSIVDDLYEYMEGVIKITALSLDKSHHNFKTYVEGQLNPKLHAVEAGLEWIDVSNLGVNKGNAMQVIMDKYDIKHDQVVSFGDYFNDLEMIQLAKYGYVVENGAEGLKAHAYEVIGKNTDDAVINKIIEHLEK